MKTFSFRYPQRKTSHGLESGDRAGHSTSPLKEIKRPENISQHSERTSCCVSCGPVLLKPHIFCIHSVQFGAQKGLQHFNVPVGGHSYCCTTFLKKVRANHTKFGNCTPNSYTRRVKRLFLEFMRVTFSPVAKILLVYGSTEVEVSLNALCVAITEQLFS